MRWLGSERVCGRAGGVGGAQCSEAGFLGLRLEVPVGRRLTHPTDKEELAQLGEVLIAASSFPG